MPLEWLPTEVTTLGSLTKQCSVCFKECRHRPVHGQYLILVHYSGGDLQGCDRVQASFLSGNPAKIFHSHQQSIMRFLWGGQAIQNPAVSNEGKGNFRFLSLQGGHNGSPVGDPE